MKVNEVLDGKTTSSSVERVAVRKREQFAVGRKGSTVDEDMRTTMIKESCHEEVTFLFVDLFGNSKGVRKEINRRFIDNDKGLN